MGAQGPSHTRLVVGGTLGSPCTLVMSQTMGRKSAMGTPCATRACCRASKRSRRLATATTRMPAAANASHTAQPMPDEAPVTSATLPCHLHSQSIFLISRNLHLWQALWSGAAASRLVTHHAQVSRMQILPHMCQADTSCKSACPISVPTLACTLMCLVLPVH